MQLEKIKDDLYVPTDFGKYHGYYADEKGEKEYTGVTTILGVLAKPALYGWYARMSAGYIGNALEKKIKECSASCPSEEMLTLTDDESIEWLRQLIIDAPNTGTKKKEAAGQHGTDAHALVEEFIGDCLLMGGVPATPMEKTAVKLAPIQKFVEWANENVDHFLFSERRMCDSTLWIAGTADFAYVGKDGKKYMADFKTSSGIYGIDYWCQVAAYRYLSELEGATYDGMTIVRLGKKGDFEVQHLYDYETYKNAFLACLTLYRAQASLKGMVVGE